ncbi:MAG: DedA family protein [Candidatus Carbobacillus altaicus]|nr:DedA family protein [Candidatus Carbobacillus altaicus]
MEAWLMQYGLWFLSVALLVEMIALPVPGETMMLYVGYMVSKGVFPWVVSIVHAAIGSMIGITIAYGIGYGLGEPFVRRFGRFVHLTPERFEKAAGWFDRYGYPLIAVGYFIPGVRHVTGYFAGMMRVPYHHFALFAYFGALFWAAFFISLGKWLGASWQLYHKAISHYTWWGGIVLAILVFLYLIYQYYRQKIWHRERQWIEAMLSTTISLRRIRFWVVLGLFLVLILSLFLADWIEDALAHQTGPFDQAMTRIALGMEEDLGLFAFKGVDRLVTLPVLFALGALLIVLIWRYASTPRIELVFLSVMFFGAYGLHMYVGMSSHAGALSGWLKFPDSTMFLAISVWGYTLYTLVRLVVTRMRKKTFWTVLLSLLIGTYWFYLMIDKISSGTKPSALIAGGLFGLIWLVLNLLTLEVMRHILEEVEARLTRLTRL